MVANFKKVTRLFAVVMIAGGVALSGCASNSTGDAVAAGEEVTSADVMGADVDDEAAGEVKIAVIGPDAAGADCLYADESTYALADVEDAWDLSEKAFGAAELVFDASDTEYGVLLNSIESPVDGTVLAWDDATGKYWQLFVDGQASEVGIDGVALEDGTEVVWYYSAMGDPVPDVASLEPVAALDEAA